MHRFFLT